MTFHSVDSEMKYFIFRLWNNGIYTYIYNYFFLWIEIWKKEQEVAKSFQLNQVQCDFFLVCVCECDEVTDLIKNLEVVFS